jgi:hypothetical protein
VISMIAHCRFFRLAFLHSNRIYSPRILTSSNAYLLGGNADAAVELLYMAVEKHSKQADLRYRLATAYMMQA